MINYKRAAPTIVAAVLATVYVIVSPPSFDLAAHLLRAKLFRAEGFGLWNNWWYAGHHTLGYSVLFPPIEAALSPQLAAGLACVATAALFELLAYEHFGPDAWLGSVWFGAATASNLFTGRLAFAFGMLPAVAAMVALQRGRGVLATIAAVLAALASPVAALFAALGGASVGLAKLIKERRLPAALPGVAVVVGALLPVGLLALAFPEGGSEPFQFASLWPVLVISAVAFFALPREELTLRIGVLLYGCGTLAAYAVSSPVGSNAARLAALIGGPLAALLWWKRHPGWLLAAVLPLAYVQWQAPVRDVTRSANDPSVQAAYYEPLLAYLRHQTGPPVRLEIPFTKFHWETYDVAPYFPLARGWERQLDIKYNHLFYDGTLNAATYKAWLHSLAVRFVAISDARLDFSAEKETALVKSGLPYLTLVMRSRHWRVYAVSDPTPIVQGPATLSRLGPDDLTIDAHRAGTLFVRVRFTPYWSVQGGPGCVAPDGDFTAVTVPKPERVRLAIAFSFSRIGAHSRRCS
jgi:hypothetical protein